MKGKDRCKILKEIRQAIAQENAIAFVTSECKHKGDCLGTCPACEAEVRYLERELEKRQKLGKAVAIAGLTAAITVSSVGCVAQDSDVTVGILRDGDHPEITSEEYHVQLRPVEELKEMTETEQLDYVKSYFRDEIEYSWAKYLSQKNDRYDAFEFPSGGFLLIYYSAAGAVELIETSAEHTTESSTAPWDDPDALMGEPDEPYLQ